MIGGENLTDLGVERFDDLQTVVPSLSVSDSGLTQSVNIRGVGLASGSPSAANGVATYIDGVFQPPIVSTNSFYDIGSVEVLRGPQGTFVGSNCWRHQPSLRMGSTPGTNPQSPFAAGATQRLTTVAMISSPRADI